MENLSRRLFLKGLAVSVLANPDIAGAETWKDVVEASDEQIFSADAFYVYKGFSEKFNQTATPECLIEPEMFSMDGEGERFRFTMNGQAYACEFISEDNTPVGRGLSYSQFKSQLLQFLQTQGVNDCQLLS